MFGWSAEYFTAHISSIIGNGQNSKLLPLKSFMKNMQWLVKSVSSSFSNDSSYEAKAKDSTRKAKAGRLRTSKLSSRILEDKPLCFRYKVRLYQHLEYNNILYKYQFGFRKNHGSNLALIEVIDSIYRT